MLFTIAILVRSFREGRAATKLELLAGSVSLGLTLMAHPGSVFSLPSFAVLGLRHRRFVSLPQLAVAASIVLCFVLPWSAYQRWIDPPGDRLLKMHLGGEQDPTPGSTWQVVRDAYRNHSLAEILRFKVANLAQLLGRSPGELVGVNAVNLRPEMRVDAAIAERSRIAQREYIRNALGVLNIGWAVGLLMLVRRRVNSAVPFGGWLIAAALVNFVVWSLVLFSPGATVTTHASYADILLLSVGLLGWILTLPRFAVVSLVVLQTANLLLVWVWPR
jgi:hypothetical protein